MGKEKDKTDNDLVKSFHAGDERSFDELVLRYQDMVFRVCYRFLGDYEEANDCAQETFVKVYRALGGFRFSSSFSTWLYRVAINTCKNTLSSSRFRKRKETLSLDHGSEPAHSSERIAGSRVIENHRSSPEHLFERKERMEAIQREIEVLPKDQRMVVILRDIEHLSYDEITKITGFADGTVKSKLYRARQKLMEGLKEFL
jgi:RNA polymerase sigma-70 factor (ECF subfamily)